MIYKQNNHEYLKIGSILAFGTENLELLLDENGMLHWRRGRRGRRGGIRAFKIEEAFPLDDLCRNWRVQINSNLFDWEPFVNN